MYPSIEPYDQGLLPVGDGNAIYWECCGNPKGKPAIYLHGGPGSGSTPNARRYFDPETYRTVLFDQRGCGRSQPLLTDRSQLQFNTTHRLIQDIETLRTHLSIDRWVVLGVSWGTTLGLVYAQQYPQHVAGLVLACVTTTSHREVDWITNGVGRIFPQEWERFASHLPTTLRDFPIVDAYSTLLFDEDPSVSAAAAAAWCAWEDSHVALNPGHVPNRRFLDPDFRLRFARIVTHFWSSAAFLQENQLFDNIDRLRDTSGVLIHGRFDVSSPLETAWLLHKRWNRSQLRIVDDAGHGGGSLPDQVVAATNEFRSP